MKASIVKTVLIFLAFGCLAGVAAGRNTSMPPIPNPVLVFIGQEYYETGGKQFTRYMYTVFNLTDFPNELFAAAPTLPPCGANTKASRTWVDFY